MRPDATNLAGTPSQRGFRLATLKHDIQFQAVLALCCLAMAGFAFGSFVFLRGDGPANPNAHWRGRQEILYCVSELR